MSYALTKTDPTLYPAQGLSSEFGWQDVQRGLGKILQGYAVLFGGAIFCFGMIALAVLKMTQGHVGKVTLEVLWLFYLGLGLSMVIFPVGYGLLALGHWRCLMHAPERFHSKWLMFACMTCLLMGPALNVTACTTGFQRAPEIKGGPDGFKKMKFTNLGLGMQISSLVISYASLVFFTLFLRSVARCFEDWGRVRLVNLYIVYLVLLAGATVFVVFLNSHLLREPPMLISLAGAWFLVFPAYLFLILSARNCISRGLTQMPVPLEPIRQTPAPMVWPTI